MLVLSRRLNQAVVFPDTDTKIRILSAKGNVIRLGIEAPPDVPVLREELCAEQAISGAIPHRDEMPLLINLIRERLKDSAIGLGSAQLLLDARCEVEAGQALTVVRNDLQQLRWLLDEKLHQTSMTKSDTPCKGRALLVEDDGNQRELLAGFLRMAGLEVDTAGDGADALDYLHKHSKPDVVLLDMGMPRCDGVTAVRQIRHDPTLAGLRIVAVTGSSPDEFDLPRGSAGIDRWVRKPVDPIVLLHDLTQEIAETHCLV